MDGQPGHFEGLENMGGESGGRNDCLFEALRAKGYAIDRNKVGFSTLHASVVVTRIFVLCQVADLILTDEFVKSHIRMGVQRHYVGYKGALGGLRQSQTFNQNNLDWLNKLPEKQEEGAEQKRDKSTRARAKKEGEGVVKGSGNNEIVPGQTIKPGKDGVRPLIKKNNDWKEETGKTEADNNRPDSEYNFNDAHMHARFVFYHNS